MSMCIIIATNCSIYLFNKLLYYSLSVSFTGQKLWTAPVPMGTSQWHWYRKKCWLSTPSEHWLWKWYGGCYKSESCNSMKNFSCSTRLNLVQRQNLSTLKFNIFTLQFGQITVCPNIPQHFYRFRRGLINITNVNVAVPYLFIAGTTSAYHLCMC